jgi:hypothetical protein
MVVVCIVVELVVVVVSWLPPHPVKIKIVARINETISFPKLLI